MNTQAQMAKTQIVRYLSNKEYTQAFLFFQDGSHLQFEHSVGNRWAMASTSPSMADTICNTLKLFRLNAKHLQLYFQDDSDVEFTNPEISQ